MTFQPVSPKLTTVRFVSLGLGMAALAVGVVAAFAFGPLALGIALSLLWLVATVWAAGLIPRRTRALGYFEGDTDLVMRQGVMFRKETLVPYGRMQYVLVEAGPIEQRFGLATLKLHTAAEDTLALPGLPRPEADALRNRLAARGESHLAGL